MNLIGEYTTGGAQLAAKVLAGQSALVITRCAAGDCATPGSSAAMLAERQALTLAPQQVSGNTVTYPARLISANAAAGYALREIGLYALSGGSEILYKLYRPSQVISISPDCSMTANFYLGDTVAQNRDITVTVDPAGALTLDNFSAVTDRLPVIDTSADRSYSCAAGELPGLIGSLPKLICGNIGITVTGGALSGNIILRGFYGPGTLTIQAQTPRITLDGYILVEGCALGYMTLKGFTLSGALYPLARAGLTGAAVCIKSCRGTVELCNITVTEPSVAKTGVGFYAAEGSQMCLNEVYAKNRYACLGGDNGARIYCKRFTGRPAENCTYLHHSCYGVLLQFTSDSVATLLGIVSSYTMGGCHALYSGSVSGTSTQGEAVA